MTERTISHYRILEPLGEGGMGVVYKAEDTRLKRTVALKFLSQDVTGTGEQSERFLREAQAAAALDHPNICTVYEIDEKDGETFLAMAFLEGQPLDERIQRGPLPLDLVYEIAKQAAEGLSAAHESGVVHRDVKSSNIMISEDRSGRPVVKLMDFGLAQISGVSKLTKVDTRMGTVAYMSPEQSLGEEVGPQSDLWSLGVVIYEMVAGDLPFRGHYDQAVLYSILNEEPIPVTSLRSRVPMELEWIIEKCLAKTPADRYREARELVSDLELLQRRTASGRTSIHVIEKPGPTEPGGPPEEGRAKSAPHASSVAEEEAVPTPAVAPPRARSRAAWLPAGRPARLAVAAAIAIAFAIGLLVPVGGDRDPPQLRRFTMRPVEALKGDASIRNIAISPDGRVIAFSSSGAQGGLWLQPLERLDPFRVAGTEGARDVFWSPDSEFVGFATNKGIGKVALRGLTLTMLVEDDWLAFASATWSADGESIYYNVIGGRMMVVSALGGIPKPLFGTSPRRRSLVSSLSTIGHSDDNQILLYSESTFEGDCVMVRRLSGDQAGEAVQVVFGDSPVYSETGHIVYRPSAMTSALWAVPFSPENLQAEGEPFAIAQDGSDPSVSSDGTLVYLHNPNSRQMRLYWFNRDGETVGTIGRPQAWILGPRVSPSGNSVLVSGGSGRDFDLWVHGSDREVITRLTFDDIAETGATWAPDELRVVLTQRGSPELKVLTVGQGSPAETLYVSESGPVEPLDWSRDGRHILVQRRRASGGDRPPQGVGSAPNRAPGKAGGFGAGGSLITSIDYLERSGEAWELREFLPEGPFIVDDGVFSPDGRYVAYESNESGALEIYVKPFPSGSQRWQVTTEGGRLPRWGADGKTLYFLHDDTLFEVPVDTADGFRADEPERLFSRDSLVGLRRNSTYDVGPGNRFALVDHVGTSDLAGIRIVLNWLSEFTMP